MAYYKGQFLARNRISERFSNLEFTKTWKMWKKLKNKNFSLMAQNWGAKILVFSGCGWCSFLIIALYKARLLSKCKYCCGWCSYFKSLLFHNEQFLFRLVWLGTSINDGWKFLGVRTVMSDFSCLVTSIWPTNMDQSGPKTRFLMGFRM